jgi:hypothetical protein
VKRKITILLLYACSLGFLQENCLADYIEAIDTTDINGYGLDSTFQLAPNQTLSGQKLACYINSVFGGVGPFNYVMSEIKLAADSSSFGTLWGDLPYPYRYPTDSYCFVTRKNSDSTYSKVQIIGKLTDGRYVFKYGTNTAPNNRMLELATYDRSVRYKPNNLFYQYRGYPDNSFSWEPPLQNNNHLIGYILYVQKTSASIDASASINLAQWDSVGFTDATRFTYSFYPSGEYFNLVAVYTEGRSDFLQGWTRLEISSSIQSFQMPDHLLKPFSVQRTSLGFLFVFNKSSTNAVMNIFSTTGQQIARFLEMEGNSIFWNPSDRNISPGAYIANIELPDKTSFDQKFMFSK